VNGGASARAVALVLASACTNTDPPRPTPAPPASAESHRGDAGHVPPASAVRDATPPTPDASSPSADGLDPFRTALPESAKSIGHTSVVFKLKLAGGRTAAWKPRSKRGNDRYKGEIAAYRLGLALGLSNVPPAIPREVSLAAMTRAVGDPGSDAARLLREEAIPDEGGNVRGALIPWIDHLGFAPLETTKPEWRGWLSPGGAVPPEKRQLAADISTMLVFDYLTANWDRWSGGNIGQDPATGRLLFIDNDGAFFERPPPEPLAGMRRQLEGVGHFSRGLVGKLRSLDLAALAAAMGDERPGRPLLPASVLSGVMLRKTEVLSIVDALLAKRPDAGLDID